MNYFRILHFIEKGNRDLFSYPKEEQITFLSHLGEAKDDIDRGFKQYLCQNQLVRPVWKKWLLNIVGAVALPFFLLFFLAKRVFAKKSEHIDCLIEKKGMPEVVPSEVREKYHPSEEYEVSSSLCLADLGFCWRLICRAPLHPYFVFKAMMNVARYSHLIYRYTPKTMIQFGEFSFSGTVLTEYCHRHGVMHVDVMHGEKLFFIRDSYFHYDETYVWDKHYVDMMTSLKAEPSQFKIAMPPSMQIESEKYKNPSAYADYKYYLAIFNEEQIVSIVKSMAFAKKEGKTVKYRPHPRYSDMDLLLKYVNEDDVENPRNISIQDSIANMWCAVGSYTTVLVQAYFSGKKILLDDVTYKEQQDKLRELDYILSSETCKSLSSLQ